MRERQDANAVPSRPRAEREGQLNGPHAVVLALQVDAGNAATTALVSRRARTLARYANAEELRRGLREHPVADLAEAYHFLNGLSLHAMVRALVRLSGGELDRLSTQLPGARGVNIPRLRVGLAAAFGIRRGQDAVAFYVTHWRDLDGLAAAERAGAVDMLPPSPVRSYGRFRGFLALPPAAQVRMRMWARGVGATRAAGALHAALIAALATASDADDPDRPEFFRHVVAAGEGLLPWRSGAAVTPRDEAERSLVGPGTRSRRAGPVGSFDAREWTASFPDAPSRTPGRRMEQVIRIYSPVSRPPHGRAYIAPGRLAEELGHLPPEARRQIHSITIEAHAPRDPSVVAEAGASGDVTYYPLERAESGAELRATLIHEAGHVISQRHWGAPPRDARDRPTSLSAGWRGWQSAMAADGFHASGYAQTDIEDDFAEAFALYLLVRGHPEETEARSLFPARWAQIDRLLADDAATSGVAERRPVG